MESDAKIRLKELRVDGGACANNLLMQFQADLLGVPVVRPKVLETTALGAGYLAGLAVGYWKDAADVAANWRVDRVFEVPDRPTGGIAAMRERLLQLLEPLRRTMSRRGGEREALAAAGRPLLELLEGQHVVAREELVLLPGERRRIELAPR